MTSLSDKDMLHKELQMFSFTHDLLGGQLLKKWSFPENLVTAVAFHHRPEEAVQERDLAHIIQLADIIAFYCCNPELLGEETILTAAYTLLPQIKSQWHALGFTLDDDKIGTWYGWLSTHRDKRFSLEEAFAA